MKILQIGKFWPVLGGVEKVMYDLTKGLCRKGVRCDMLCASMNGGAEVIHLNDNGKVIVVKTLIKAKSTMLSSQMVQMLRKIAPFYDIIHIHHPDPMAALALYASGYKGKVVLHWHSDILRQRILKKLYLPLQGWLLRRADTIICTSQNYIEGSAELRPYLSKICCIPIGVEPIVPDKNIIADIKKKYAGRKIVFSLGRLIPYKGFDNLIKSAEHLPDDYLVIIAGEGPLRKDLEKLIADKNLGAKVIMPGRITDKYRDAMLASSSVFCLPSVEKTEAFGIVLIEAMSVGLPIVATNIQGSGTSWVNAHGVSGLNVECKDPDKLAEAIVEIVANHNPDHYPKNSRKRWEELFTFDRFIENVNGVYRNMMK